MTLESRIASFPTPHELPLSFVGIPFRIMTNDPDIWRGLSSYYRPYVGAGRAGPVFEVRLVQGGVAVEGAFVDLPRAAGRKVKEAVQEVPGGRLILKRATGVVMALWPGGAFAAGDLRANLNQGINLINNCYAKIVLRRGHLLLHASAVLRDERTVALAGPPGAGKSTAALHLVEAGFRFLSNDRVLAAPLPDGVEVLGYPKQPRVNPGTLLHHPRLSSVLAPDERARLEALSRGELRALERKSDVDLEAVYGKGTVDLRGRLEALVLLKWRWDGRGLSVRRMAPEEGLADLPLFYRNLGAFDPDRPANSSVTPSERARYAELLARVRVVEVEGRVDFAALVRLVGELLPPAPVT